MAAPLTVDEALASVRRILALGPKFTAIVNAEDSDDPPEENDPDLEDWPADRHITRTAKPTTSME